MYRFGGRLLPSLTLGPLDPARSHVTSSCGHKGPLWAGQPLLVEKGPGPGRPGHGGPWDRTLSYLLLPVLGQQQADLCQLLLDDLLVDHVQLQARLWVFGKHLLLGVVLVIAGSAPPFFFLVASGRLQVRKWGTRTLPPPRGPGGAASLRAHSTASRRATPP